MADNRELIDTFEYKGKDIKVMKDQEGDCCFIYNEEEKEIELSITEIKSFIEGSFSHVTINNNIVDMIEKSVKINNFLFNLKDLTKVIQKYN